MGDDPYLGGSVSIPMMLSTSSTGLKRKITDVAATSMNLCYRHNWRIVTFSPAVQCPYHGGKHLEHAQIIL